MKSKLLIVDDDPEIMDWLYLDLQLSGYCVDYALNGLSGLQKAQQNKYDLIILDVMMPKINGFDVCKNLRDSNFTKDIPIILLTAKGTIEDKIKGFNSGADDYLAKPFDIQELLVRIRALLRRTNSQESSASSEILKTGDIEIFPDSLEAKVQEKLVKLTPTEFEILYCLMQHYNKAVSLTNLLNEVWGYDSDEDVRIVRVHVGGLRQKIEPSPKSPKYLQTITNVGYKLVPQLEESNE